MAKIIIYTAPDGHVQITVNLAHDTIWLSQQQMADLFGTKRQAITKHLKNIFIAGELAEDSACSILEQTAKDGKSYKTKFYSLDAVISVGYRVNSLQATHFRIWATNVLRGHLINGYTIYKPRLAQKGVDELQKTVELLHKTLQANELVTDLGAEAIQLILSYAKTWSLLLAYDEERLVLPEKGNTSGTRLNYTDVSKTINTLKTELIFKQEATPLFGQERNNSMQSILSNIEQTFDGIPLYKTVEEKAAHLLYFIIKDHPYVDGNKRIGCFVFLLYLKLQNIVINLNENGLVALALLLAESAPEQKEILIKLIVNILSNEVT
jgi:prophage maintenance system killer protein